MTFLLPALFVLPWELQWEADPTNCPSAAEVEQRIERLVPSAIEVDDPLRVRGVITREGEHFRLQLWLGNGSEPRTVTAPGCRELADVAALVVAIGLDPEVLTREPTPAPVAEPEVAAVEPTKNDVTAEPVPPSSPPRRRGPKIFGYGQVQGGLVYGVVPGLTGGFGLEGGFGGTGFRVGLGMLYAIPQYTQAPDNPAVGGRFQAVTGRVRVCGVPETRELEFPLCFELQVGGVIGTGLGAITPKTAASPWVGGALGPMVLWRPGRGQLGVFFGVDGIVAITRPAFDSEASGIIYRVPPAGFQALVGVEWRSR